MTTPLNESHVEAAAIEWFQELGYAFVPRPGIAPGEPAAQRESFADVVLAGRLREAVERLNPQVPTEAREEALRKVLRVESPSLVATNQAFHAMLRDGVEVEYRRPDGSIVGDRVRLVDFDDADMNDWLVTNQFTVIEAGHNRRPDIVVFVNGLPLAILELKNAADSDSTIWNAYAQLQTYKSEVPSLLRYNELLIVSEKGQRMATLSDRQNIVVIADEAHRSQYDLIDGLARNMRDALPNASFIGFTGTPIEKTDANTRAVFGDYISIYDIQRAVADKATVPIYYESRIAKLGLNATEVPKLDAEFDEITEGEEEASREKLKTKWAAIEALVGNPKRLALIAADLVAHFEKRWEALDGKAMVVCMSRRICVALHDAILKLRPDWASIPGDDADAETNTGKKCVLKVIMTGSADDGPDWQPHIRNKERRRTLATRFKNPADPFRIVIVRDMWLTGFDAPCLHTMYADKPMQGHGLMQAIARVNRVFRDKPGGLVVDYLGLAHLSAQNPAIDRRRVRRPLFPEEFARLLESVENGPGRQSLAGPDRVIVHILACYTGLRRNKIGSVKAYSFNFDSDPPTLTVDAGYSKHRRTDVMPIRVDLAKRIQDWIASKKKLDPTKPLVNVALKRTAEMLKKDLAAARSAWITESSNAEERQRREHSTFLKYQNDQSQYADFHALR